MFEYGFIMAGGMGTRLRPLTGAIPKPLLPIGDKPIIQFIIENMRNHGTKTIFISINYKKEIIKNYLRDGSRYGVEIIYIEENEKTGTAGSLTYLPSDFSEDLLVSNGDLICDIEYANIFEMLNNYDMVLTGIEKNFSIDFGVLNIEEENKLHSWSEKPNMTYIINGGIYGISKESLDFIKENVNKNDCLDMPCLWDLMKRENKKLGVYVHKGKWHDVGRMEDYMALTNGGI